jgi:glutaredoxin
MKYLFLIALLFSADIHAGATPEPLRLAALADYDEEQQKVVMYATSWCPYCEHARNYFRQQGIPYIEYDIEKDADAKRAYQAFGGRGIPVIFVGKRGMSGWSKSGFNSIYRDQLKMHQRK